MHKSSTLPRIQDSSLSKQSQAYAHALPEDLTAGWAWTAHVRKTVGWLLPKGGECGLLFSRPCWDLVGLVDAAARKNVPISVCGVCGHCAVRSTSQDAGPGGRERVRAGRAGRLGEGRALLVLLVPLEPRSLTPDFLLSASVWRCVNFQGS